MKDSSPMSANKIMLHSYVLVALWPAVPAVLIITLSHRIRRCGATSAREGDVASLVRSLSCAIQTRSFPYDPNCNNQYCLDCSTHSLRTPLPMWPRHFLEFAALQYIRYSSVSVLRTYPSVVACTTCELSVTDL